MTQRDPNLERIEVVAAALGPLREHVVFVGGCAAGLLISDPAATPIRATLDVDLVVNVTVLTEYHRIEEEFADLGFKRDMSAEAPICRWVYRNIAVDLMPTDAHISDLPTGGIRSRSRLPTPWHYRAAYRLS